MLSRCNPAESPPRTLGPRKATSQDKSDAFTEFPAPGLGASGMMDLFFAHTDANVSPTPSSNRRRPRSVASVKSPTEPKVLDGALLRTVNRLVMDAADGEVCIQT